MYDTALRMVEISQDGAGLALRRDPYPGGFYTTDIQTCIIYAFRGSDEFCVIHDTGQIAIEDVVALVRRIGVLDRVTAAQNSRFRADPQYAEHKKRAVRMLSSLDWNGSIQHVDASKGWVAFPRSGKPLTTGQADVVGELPDRSRRLQVNLLNNMFSAQNSQSVRVDLQHVDGEYTPFPALAFETERMLARGRREIARGDPDYLSELHRAWQMGLFEGVDPLSS